MARQILLAIRHSIDRFLDGVDDLAELQTQLVANASALDRRLLDLSGELEAIEADLERIRFAVLRDEQRPAATLRIERTRQMIVDALARRSDDTDA